jgi:hypothetical protein
MPCLDKRLLILYHEPLDLIELMIGDALILCHRYWLKPELRDLTVAFDVYVGRLNSIRAEEHK